MSGDGITVRVYNYCASKYWYRLGRLILPYNIHTEDEKNYVCLFAFLHINEKTIPNQLAICNTMLVAITHELLTYREHSRQCKAL